MNGNENLLELYNVVLLLVFYAQILGNSHGHAENEGSGRQGQLQLAKHIIISPCMKIIVYPTGERFYILLCIVFVPFIVPLSG